MKKTVFGRLAVMLITVLLLAGLTGCTKAPASSVGSQPEESSTPPASESLAGSSVPASQPASAADSSVAPADDFEGWVTISDTPANTAGDRLGETMLSEEQNVAIVTLVQRVVDGYRDGVLPLPVPEASEYWLNEPMPEGVQLPEAVAYGDFALANFDERWQMEASLPLNDGWVLKVWVSRALTEEGVFIHIDQALFEQAKAI